MKILVVAEEYYPTANANVNCLDKLIWELVSRSHDVTVLTPDYENNLPSDEIFQKWNIHRIHIPERNRINKSFFEGPLSHLPAIIQGLLGHFFLWFLHILKARRARKWVRSQQFEKILSLAYPVDSHELAFRLAQKNVPWVLYNLDPYVFNQSITNQRKARMRNEKRWGRKASGIVDTIGIQQENARHNYFPFTKQKKIEVALPNLEFEERSEYKDRAESDFCILRYAGMFYSQIRRPDELLKILNLLDPQKYIAEFYGPCCDYLRQNFKQLPPCVRLMGTVSIDECKRLVNSADILINVGNNCTNQIPSKIFEYISTGKPILNIYSTDSELALEYLHRYPNIISTNSAQTVTLEQIELLAHKKPLSIEEIRRIYPECLRENVVCSIADFLESV